MSTKSPKLVRYVSPFGSPAWMTREEAQRHLEEDDKMYVELSEVGMLADFQREIGPPRIEGTDLR